MKRSLTLPFVGLFALALAIYLAGQNAKKSEPQTQPQPQVQNSVQAKPALSRKTKTERPKEQEGFKIETRVTMYDPSSETEH